jgi:serine acetyltransferase
VGLNAAVLPGVRVGARARVGAGAVAPRDVPAGATVIVSVPPTGPASIRAGAPGPRRPSRPGG